MTSPATVVDAVRTSHDPAGATDRARRPTARVEVSLLGGFRVRVDDRAIPAKDWSRRHSTALVKLLAMSADRSMHREQVIDALWPDTSIEDAAPRLHKAAHYARKILGHPGAIVLSNDTVRLFPDADVHVDLWGFQHLARSAVDSGGLAAAKGALAAYPGELLPQDPYETWAHQHRLHLNGLHLELLHQAQDWHQALAADPTDEVAHLALVQRYAERGDRRAALRQLDRLDRVMRHELGLEPGQRARDLRRQLAEPASEWSSRGDAGAGDHRASTSSASEQHQPCCRTSP